LAEQRPSDALAALARSGPDDDLDAELTSSRRLLAERARAELGGAGHPATIIPGSPLSARIAMYSAWQRGNWADLERAASALLEATAPDQAPFDAVAGMVLAQARRGSGDLPTTIRRLAAAQVTDDDTRRLLAMLASPSGEASIDAKALLTDESWLRSVRAYLEPLTAPPS
jgi:hypothetical protein